MDHCPLYNCSFSGNVLNIAINPDLTDKSGLTCTKITVKDKMIHGSPSDSVCLLKEHPGFTPELRGGQSAAMSEPFHTPMALSLTLGIPMLSSVSHLVITSH